ncbi:MAG TPA: LPXTG cell wall anchor domain-containing protein, partial [Thermoanaerobaculia bacterium]
VQEQGTVEGTATESMNDNQGANTTGQTTGTTGTATGTTGTQDTTMHPETESTNTPVDVDVDTGNKAQGAVDVDVSTTPDADTDASGVNETGETNTGTYGGGDTNALPDTASDLPTLALIGLLALAAAFVLRRVARNA